MILNAWTDLAQGPGLIETWSDCRHEFNYYLFENWFAHGLRNAKRQVLGNNKLKFSTPLYLALKSRERRKKTNIK